MSPTGNINSSSDSATHSPIRRGADCGLQFGLWFTAMFLSYIYASLWPALAIVTLALAAGVPFKVFRTLRREYRLSGSSIQVTSLWIQGIVMISAGALICALVTLVFFRWIDPGYIVRQLHQIIELYRTTSDPSLAEMARVAQGLIDNGTVPRPSTWVLSMWLFTVTSGSILSGLMAILVRASARKPSPHTHRPPHSPQ